jgi:hypothetical protein
MSGWALRDSSDPVRTVVGTLIDVHNSDSDGDTDMLVVPDAASAPLLINRHGARNAVYAVGCEVNVTEDGDARSRFERWVSSMIGPPEVTVKGVYVDDTGHEDKTEIHPMDLIIARVSGSALPHDWIGDLAQQNAVQVGVGLFAFRYAAASDDRGGESPPLAGQTRATSVTLPFPVRLAGATEPQVEVRSAGARNAASHIDTTVVGDTASAELVVTVKSGDDGGPGFDLAEIALYWSASRALLVNPGSLDFGLVGIGQDRIKTFTITSIGSAPATVTVPDSTSLSPFSWTAVPPTVLPPGGSLSVTVEFSPGEAGRFTDTASVLSDAGESPHVVRLKGRAGGIPQ